MQCLPPLSLQMNSSEWRRVPIPVIDPVPPQRTVRRGSCAPPPAPVPGGDDPAVTPVNLNSYTGLNHAKFKICERNRN